MKIFFVTAFFIGGLCSAIQGQSPTVGLIENDLSSTDGIVLFAPNGSKQTFLMNKCDGIVHSWNSNYLPGLSAYLLENGDLLRAGTLQNPIFTAGGSGGIIERTDWNGNPVWHYIVSDTLQCQHHDIHPMPNGNILAIVWERKSINYATDAGREPSLTGSNGVWFEKIIELKPIGNDSASIVWEWHLTDHLVQDYDNSLSNYGDIAANPGLMNVNYRANGSADWAHLNSIDYNASLDQILISSRNFDEVYIIDHGTTTAEAGSHHGGRRGRGGDFLYRWGNPESYNHGSVTSNDHRLFGQHNAQWITTGFPNEGKILVFNNGNGRPGGNYSSINIVSPPVDSSGMYTASSLPFGPSKDTLVYKAPDGSVFYSAFIGGVQQLNNGNTLICNGQSGDFFEVNASKNKVWEYINPQSSGMPLSQGELPVQNSVFRCTLYPLNYPAFVSHALQTGTPLETNPLQYPCNTVTSVSSPTTDLPVWVYPNPANGGEAVNISLAETEYISILHDSEGRMISSEKNMKTISTNELRSGLYFLTIIANNGHVVLKKLVVSR
ncbi:MAG TPA: aryl-sulfate sulfotransferase [Bacteroidia bacterium]|jgi:hypothetical protein|nr:aryl-sulfate sulfotransferase [Bacteroidia bacterium]